MSRFLGCLVAAFALIASPFISTVSAQTYDFGDHTSALLVSKAWSSLASKDYSAVTAYAKKCIELYGQKASEQEASLQDFAPSDKAFDYWALNDVATAYFILGKSFKEQKQNAEAKEAFKKIVSDYAYAQCWQQGKEGDKDGFHWRVAEAAKDELNLLDSTYDFGDYTSQTLVSKAWDALAKKDYQGVEVFTKKAIQLYEEEAQKMQQGLTEYPAKDKAFNYWALNDVGTAYFVLGSSYEEQKKFPEALEVYKVVMEDFSYAQCWDPKGWFWKPAVAARGKINKIKAEQGL